MPLIQVDMFEGRSPEIKREFVEGLTRETCRLLKCEPAAVQIILRDVKKIRLGHGRGALVGKEIGRRHGTISAKPSASARRASRLRFDFPWFQG